MRQHLLLCHCWLLPAEPRLSLRFGRTLAELQASAWPHRGTAAAQELRTPAAARGSPGPRISQTPPWPPAWRPPSAPAPPAAPHSPRSGLQGGQAKRRSRLGLGLGLGWGSGGLASLGRRQRPANQRAGGSQDWTNCSPPGEREERAFVHMARRLRASPPAQSPAPAAPAAGPAALASSAAARLTGARCSQTLRSKGGQPAARRAGVSAPQLVLEKSSTAPSVQLHAARQCCHTLGTTAAV